MLIIFLGIRASMAVLVGCFTGNFSTCKRSINQVDDDHAGALIIILSFGGKFSAKIIPRERVGTFADLKRAFLFVFQNHI